MKIILNIDGDDKELWAHSLLSLAQSVRDRGAISSGKFAQGEDDGSDLEYYGTFEMIGDVQ